EIPQHLFSAGGPLLFIPHGLVQTAQRILDALHRPPWFLPFEPRLVDPRSPDEQFRQPRLVGTNKQRPSPAPAQDLEAAEQAPHLQGQILAPRQNGLRQRRRATVSKFIRRYGESTKASISAMKSGFVVKWPRCWPS